MSLIKFPFPFLHFFQEMIPPHFDIYSIISLSNFAHIWEVLSNLITWGIESKFKRRPWLAGMYEFEPGLNHFYIHNMRTYVRACICKCMYTSAQIRVYLNSHSRIPSN